MKNLSYLLLIILASFATNTANAQATSDQISLVDTEQKASKTMANEVEILKDFKATKEQKKVINKIKKYVSPRILGRAVNTAALEGKTVKLQMGLNAQGKIEHIVVVDGIGAQLDEKVVSLVKEYNDKKPLANTGIAPAVIQMEIPVGSNKYYGR